MTKQRLRRWIVGGLVSFVLAMCLFTPWPTDLLTRPLTVNETLQPADAIIVLGSGTRRGANPLPTQARLRTDRGVELWKAGLADTVIFSGGKSKATRLIESDVMAQYAAATGLPETVIIRERVSTSTRENAEQTMAIMTAKKYKTAIVVTSSYHSWRACKVFRYLQVSVQCAAATIHPVGEGLSDRLVNLISVLREYVAIGYYITRQYI